MYPSIIIIPPGAALIIVTTPNVTPQTFATSTPTVIPWNRSDSFEGEQPRSTQTFPEESEDVSENGSDEDCHVLDTSFGNNSDSLSFYSPQEQTGLPGEQKDVGSIPKLPPFEPLEESSLDSLVEMFTELNLKGEESQNSTDNSHNTVEMTTGSSLLSDESLGKS